MTTVAGEIGGALVVETASYRLELAADGMTADLSSPAGAPLASLRLVAALDTTRAADETLWVAPPRPRVGEPGVFEVERGSTVWERAATTLVCRDEAIELHASVSGRGDLADVRLLAGRSLVPGRPLGLLPSGSSFRTLFSPSPSDPGHVLLGAGEPAVIGVVGDSQPGRGHWFFTPAPLCFCLAAADVHEPTDPVPDGWLTIGLAAPVSELTFTQLAYEPFDRAFALRLEYEGHTRVEAGFTAPVLVLTPGMPNPYEGLRRHREDLAARGATPPARDRERPDWWSEPIFCGWGAQRHAAIATGASAAEFSTQERYDAFLAQLETEGVVPGTVVIDDKWQETYGACEPDTAKWPDLRGWIAERHVRGQRVLLWWKAWDPEGLPAELCMQNAAGAPVAVDPTNPEACRRLREVVGSMLAPDGLGADGLKVDFTGASPTGRALTTHGRGWGIQLLHELLAVVYRAAKEAKPDALVVTHAPHPSFADIGDMVRLNDMLRLDDMGPVPDVVPQMRHRAAIVQAACPDLLVDTDDWCAPDLETWRRYLDLKPGLGVPALYYATHLDASGEALTAADYEAIRLAWARWQASR
jgi:hypothetical protein